MNVTPKENRARCKVTADYWLMKYIDDNKGDLPKLTKSQAYEIIRDEAEKEGHVFSTNRIRIALNAFNVFFTSKGKPQRKTKEVETQMLLIVECMDRIDTSLRHCIDALINGGFEFNDEGHENLNGLLDHIEKLKHTL